MRLDCRHNQKFSLFFFLIYALTSQAQSELFKKYQSVPITTPEASSMAKFVEVPVGHFNGTPEINIISSSISQFFCVIVIQFRELIG